MIERNVGLTAERLRELLWYDPHSGAFKWLVDYSPRNRAGTLAGTYCDIYVRIRIDGVMYKAHRLAWLYMTGEWPPEDIDHRDLNRKNNRWENIRSATRSQNNANQSVRKDNKSGYKGVSLKAGKWWAQICVRGERRSLGRFATLEEAVMIYRRAVSDEFGEFARVD